jgi:hypothetical protein
MSQSSENWFKASNGHDDNLSYYSNIYAKTVTIRNKLLLCSDEWRTECMDKAQELKKFIEKNPPQDIEKNAHKACKEYFRTINEYKSCKKNYLGILVTKLELEISKKSNFLLRMNKNQD